MDIYLLILKVYHKRGCHIKEHSQIRAHKIETWKCMLLTKTVWFAKNVHIGRLRGGAPWMGPVQFVSISYSFQEKNCQNNGLPPPLGLPPPRNPGSATMCRETRRMVLPHAVFSHLLHWFVVATRNVITRTTSDTSLTVCDFPSRIQVFRSLTLTIVGQWVNRIMGRKQCGLVYMEMSICSVLLSNVSFIGVKRI